MIKHKMEDILHALIPLKVDPFYKLMIRQNHFLFQNIYS